MFNSEPDVSKVLGFIARFDVVVTSSYHGALWATYLGKRVLLFRKLTAKFDLMRYPHPEIMHASSTLLLRNVQLAAEEAR